MEKTVRIVNKTKDTVLADKAEVAETPFSRIRGLLGRQGLQEGEGLVIKPCSSIHTFFMRFSIDVIFLNKHNKVIARTCSLQPWRLFGVLFKGKLVIELPSGILQKSKTSIGDLIEII